MEKKELKNKQILASYVVTKSKNAGNKAFDTEIIALNSKHMAEGKTYKVTKEVADILVEKKVAKYA